MPKANADSTAANAKADDLATKLAAVTEELKAVQTKASADSTAATAKADDLTTQLAAVTTNLAKRDEELMALQNKVNADSTAASQQGKRGTKRAGEADGCPWARKKLPCHVGAIFNPPLVS